MLTQRIDAAFDALHACGNRVPLLRDLYRPGSRERAALDELLETLRRTHEVLMARDAKPPAI